MAEDTESFRVAVKESALEANEAVRELADAEGSVVSFGSRADAEERAELLSAEGATRVAVQAAAPADSTDADAYLVADPERCTRDPDGSIAEGLTFDVTGNQYGALGEALVLAHETNPPLLAHFAQRDLDSGDTNLRVELDADPDPVVGDAAAGTRWVPDCRAEVLVGPDRRLVEEYWCEIKTESSSAERSQRDLMRRKAREATVLLVRIDVTNLPDSYTARIRRVEPDGSDSAGVARTVRANARLDEF